MVLINWVRAVGKHIFRALYWIFYKLRYIKVSLDQATYPPFELRMDFDLTYRFFRHLWQHVGHTLLTVLLYLINYFAFIYLVECAEVYFTTILREHSLLLGSWFLMSVHRVGLMEKRNTDDILYYTCFKRISLSLEKRAVNEYRSRNTKI